MSAPKTATKIHELAVANGWAIDIEVDDAEGYGMRFKREGAQVFGFWREGRWDSGLVKHPVLLPLRQGDLKELLATPVEEFGFDQWPPDLPDDPKQMIRDEYEMCGFYISGHPLDHVKMGRYPDVVETSVLDGEESGFGPGSTIQVLGIVEDPQVKRTKRGFWMAFFGVSDREGIARCFGFGEEYQEMKAGALVHVKGVIDERDGGLQIKARTVTEVDW